jgi:hypothetical protein
MNRSASVDHAMKAKIIVRANGISKNNEPHTSSEVVKIGAKARQ